MSFLTLQLVHFHANKKIVNISYKEAKYMYIYSNEEGSWCIFNYVYDSSPLNPDIGTVNECLNTACKNIDNRTMK